MTYCKCAKSSFSLIIILLFAICSSKAQLSPYDKNGNVKTVAERKYEESQNNQNKNTPKTIPTATRNTEESQTPNNSGASKAKQESREWVAKVMAWNDAVKGIDFKNKTAKYRYVDKEITKDGLIRVQFGNMFGYIDTDAREVIPVIYENVKTLPEHYYGIKLNNLWGFVNSDGKVMLTPQYDDILDESVPLGYGADTNPYLSDDAFVWVVVTKDIWEYQVTKSGTKIGGRAHNMPAGKDVHYDYLGNYDADSRLKSASLNKKWGCLSLDNKVVIPIKFDHDLNFGKDSICSAALNGKWGIINKKGEIIIALMYDNAFTLYREETSIILNGKWGIIDRQGKEILPALYDDRVEFSDSSQASLASVRQNWKTGYIDRKGKMVIPYLYDYGGKFEYSAQYGKMFTYVMINRKYGLIDESGATIIEPKYDELSAYISDGICKLHEDGRFGFANLAGKIIIPTIYDAVDGYPYGNVIKMIEGAKLKYFDYRGKKIKH